MSGCYIKIKGLSTKYFQIRIINKFNWIIMIIIMITTVLVWKSGAARSLLKPRCRTLALLDRALAARLRLDFPWKCSSIQNIILYFMRKYMYIIYIYARGSALISFSIEMPYMIQKIVLKIQYYLHFINKFT